MIVEKFRLTPTATYLTTIHLNITPFSSAWYEGAPNEVPQNTTVLVSAIRATCSAHYNTFLVAALPSLAEWHKSRVF